MQTLSKHNIFYLVVILICPEKKYVVLGGNMDFADIL